MLPRSPPLLLQELRKQWEQSQEQKALPEPSLLAEVVQPEPQVKWKSQRQPGSPPQAWVQPPPEQQPRDVPQPPEPPGEQLSRGDAQLRDPQEACLRSPASADWQRYSPAGEAKERCGAAREAVPAHGPQMEQPAEASRPHAELQRPPLPLGAEAQPQPDVEEVQP